MQNGKYQCHVARSKIPTNYHFLFNRKSHTKRAIQKAYLLTNNTGECLRRENVKRRGLQQKKDKTERVTGLDRKMKEDIGKGNPK